MDPDGGCPASGIHVSDRALEAQERLDLSAPAGQIPFLSQTGGQFSGKESVCKKGLVGTAQAIQCEIAEASPHGIAHEESSG